jgi:hypothetical protein
MNGKSFCTASPLISVIISQDRSPAREAGELAATDCIITQSNFVIHRVFATAFDNRCVSTPKFGLSIVHDVVSPAKVA